MMINTNDLYEIMINQSSKEALANICKLIKAAHVRFYVNKEMELTYVLELCYFDYASRCSSSLIKIPEKDSVRSDAHALGWAMRKEAQEDDVVSYVSRSINQIKRVSDRIIFIEYYIFANNINAICIRYNVSLNKYYASLNRATNELIEILGLKI